MDFKLILDKERKEEVVVYAKEKTALVKEIEELVNKSQESIIGYNSDEMIRLNPKEVYCFTIENNKLYAVMENDKLLIKQRLYQLEEELDNDFVKINQSSIANIKKIDRFKATLGGSLIVLFKNGYRDYVSRRQARYVKERLGVK